MPRLNLSIPEQDYIKELQLLAEELGLIAERGAGAGRYGSISRLVTLMGRASFVMGADQVADYLRPLLAALDAIDAEAERRRVESHLITD